MPGAARAGTLKFPIFDLNMEFTAQQLAAVTGGVVDGDPQAAVSDFAKIEEGRPGALSFLANPKYTPHVYDTDSTIVIVSRDFVPERPVKATLLRVDDPYATMARLMAMAQQAAAQAAPSGVEQPCHVAPGVEVPADAYVGAFAYVGPGCKIGPGVKIYPQCYLGAGVEVGQGTQLCPGVKIYHGCKIGRRCIIHAGAVIGGDGFGFAPLADGNYEKIPQLGNVVIGDDVEIGANTTVDRAMMGSTVIADGVKLDNLIQVAHNCRVGAHTVIAAQAGLAGSGKIGAHCMVGGQVGVVGHIEIADGTQIGAQSGVAHATRPGERIMGSPAIDAAQWTRNQVYIKNIQQLAERISALEKNTDK